MNILGIPTSYQSLIKAREAGINTTTLDEYDIDIADKKIDFRRVLNLNTFLQNNAITLTNNVNEIEKWQGGDIVVFERHIAIVSDKRNRKGIPYIIHHGGQIFYEEDAITRFKIIGHYRWN